MALKKKIVTPSFGERLNMAAAGSAAAVSVFENIALDLESSAVDQKVVAADIDAEIDRLEELISTYHELADEAEQAAEANLAKARSIRALTGN